MAGPIDPALRKKVLKVVFISLLLDLVINLSDPLNQGSKLTTDI